VTGTILGSSTVGDGVVASATPYPWPFHGRLDPTRTALVACLDRQWRQDGTASDERDARLVSLADALGRWGALVVGVVSLPVRRGLRTGTRPIGSADPPIRCAVTVVAGATSGFFGSELDDVLRASGRTDLVLAGWGLEGPVHSTLRAANDRGFECLLVADASTPIDEELVHASTEMVRFSGGIFGAYATTNDVLAALGEPANE
jgi:hypothetical protein